MVATDVVLQLVVSYPVELDNVQVLAARASETVKVPALVLHVNQEFRWECNQKRSPEYSLLTWWPLMWCRNL